jgi:hypothetical protein
VWTPLGLGAGSIKRVGLDEIDKADSRGKRTQNVTATIVAMELLIPST